MAVDATKVPEGLRQARRVTTVTPRVFKKIAGVHEPASLHAVVELSLPKMVHLTSLCTNSFNQASRFVALSRVACQLPGLHDRSDAQSSPTRTTSMPVQDLLANRSADVSKLLILEGVQDPGNLGTLVRTAVAMGWDAVCLSSGCCDPFSDKAIRASRGATLRVSTLPNAR